LGSSLTNQGLPRVRADHFQLVSEALQQLFRAGYQRIGLIVDAGLDERSGRRLTGAFLAAPQRRSPRSLNASILRCRQDRPRCPATWLRRQGLDAVVVDQSSRLSELRALGLRIPHDLGLASLAVEHSDRDTSGMTQNVQAMAQAALSLLSTLLNQHQLGPTPHPPELHLPGLWNPGHTILQTPNNRPSGSGHWRSHLLLPPSP
ncbi:MAG: LacI family transcriptional regulator, partial [Blastochloris sp.]|nr:LacI family transcriptional regulator [Blastochloris sp.]